MLTCLFALIDRPGMRPLFAVLGFIIVVMFAMAYFNERQATADRAAEAAELTRKCLAAHYTPEQCAFIVALAMRGPGAAPDAATLAAIQAATH